MNREALQGVRARVPGRQRLVLAALTLVAGVTAAACTAHHEALIHPCPTVAGRGVVALAKVGLSSDELKVQEKC
jgi:hypothetical protein